MKYLSFFAFLMIISFSCRDSENTTRVDLVFQANYADEVLQYNTVYQQEGGVAFAISRSDFFLSDVRLTADDGTEVVLFDYTQVDFEDSPGGVRLTTDSRIDVGNYESITFGLGLNSDLNAMSPVDFASDDVLNNSGYYWAAWDSYIFTKQEGRYDTDGDGEPDTGWIVHTGVDDIYKEVTVPIDTEISENDSEIRLIIDHEPLFVQDGEPVEFGFVHDPTNKEAFEGFYDRILANFSIEE